MKEDGSCWCRVALMEKGYTQLSRFFSTFICDNSCELFNEQICIFSNIFNSPLPLLLVLLLLPEAAVILELFWCKVL